MRGGNRFSEEDVRTRCARRADRNRSGCAPRCARVTPLV